MTMTQEDMLTYYNNPMSAQYVHHTNPEYARFQFAMSIFKQILNTLMLLVSFST